MYMWRRKWHPLQYSCLENPRKGRAWSAACCGVAKSRTQLKRLSSSSSKCFNNMFDFLLFIEFFSFSQHLLTFTTCSVAQSCLTLCSPMNWSPQSFSVHGNFQARILKRVAISCYRDLSNPGIEPISLVFPPLAGWFFTSSTWDFY